MTRPHDKWVTWEVVQFAELLDELLTTLRDNRVLLSRPKGMHPLRAIRKIYGTLPNLEAMLNPARLPIGNPGRYDLRQHGMGHAPIADYLGIVRYRVDELIKRWDISEICTESTFEILTAPFPVTDEDIEELGLVLDGICRYISRLKQDAPSQSSTDPMPTSAATAAAQQAHDGFRVSGQRRISVDVATRTARVDGRTVIETSTERIRAYKQIVDANGKWMSCAEALSPYKVQKPSRTMKELKPGLRETLEFDGAPRKGVRLREKYCVEAVD